ncbi:hypothetical protein ACH4GE_38365 [Streptomyces tendae]|uniref:Cupin domain-containing protein n=1 Tax=Streptomyces tendae TaxID=1932 RepID=A0A6B3QQ96_STRTE|nr:MULTISPECIES: hypothetical protein [Streptomyces]BET45175.1 hypothetical protein RGQ21_01570 [Kitasatospora aureofaciens]MBQ0968638.1 hypothetical protein [Streptomyces sp. RK74B]MBQ1008689.1 hypothetical protein [Streptomyces sp. RK23]MZG15442.1 hypothetical protein [Streptomyces sp. SID5914]NEV89908.1 hypothetical protein [Streptomyces tendae]
MSGTETRTIGVTRMYTDAAGETHFAEEKLDLAEVNFAPPAPSMFLSTATEAKASVYLLLPDGYFGDFHPAPRKQVMTLLKGELEVQVSDGESRRFLPGGSVLVEDVTGKGHSTRSVGGESLLIVTQL